MAISLEVIAFAALFGVGGAAFGFAVLGLTVLALLTSVVVERRRARVSRWQRLWCYYAVNDRVNARTHGRAISRELMESGAELPLRLFLAGGAHAMFLPTDRYPAVEPPSARPPGSALGRI